MHGNRGPISDHALADVDLFRSEPPSNRLDLLPGRVARWYAAIGAAWIVLTDLWVAASRDESLADRAPDLVKGLAFVGVTTLLLLGVLARITRSHQRTFRATVTRQRDFYRSVLATSSDVVGIFGPDGRLRYVNPAATTVLGWSDEQILSRPTRELVQPDERSALLGFVRNVTAGGPAQSNRVFAFRHADGSSRLMELSAAAVDLGGRTPHVVVNARDVTDRVRSERQLRAALAEGVTGLPDLRAYAAEMVMLEEIRSDRASVMALLVDVDRFGDVNALHGRSAGDRVLRELGSRMEAVLPQALGVWHPGIDEFLAAVFDAGTTDGSPSLEPTTLAERVRAALSAPVALDDDRRVSVSVSIGVARLALDGGAARGELADTLLHAVEEALVQAKSHPDRVAVHQGPDGGGVDRARLAAELHHALAEDQLVVHYQPKVRLRDGAVVGAEALVRWEHPERGLLEPAAFLPVVAAANLSGALTDVVLRHSLDQVARWLTAGCDPDFMVSVNVALDDLRRTNFVDDVFRALDRSAVAPNRLTLEITEQTMLADPAGAQAAVNRLREAGVRIAIDDFGTGFSALEHIRLFVVDELKIDKSFVQQLTRSPADEAIVDSILAIGDRLGVVVTAEGVEDPITLDHLRRNGCTLGQGYLFGRPDDADRFEPWRRYPVEPSA